MNYRNKTLDKLKPQVKHPKQETYRRHYLYNVYHHGGKK